MFNRFCIVFVSVRVVWTPSVLRDCDIEISLSSRHRGLSKLQRMVDTLSSRYRKARDRPNPMADIFLVWLLLPRLLDTVNVPSDMMQYDAISVRVHVLDVSSIERPCFTWRTTGKERWYRYFCLIHFDPTWLWHMDWSIYSAEIESFITLQSVWPIWPAISSSAGVI